MRKDDAQLDAGVHRLGMREAVTADVLAKMVALVHDAVEKGEAVRRVASWILGQTAGDPSRVRRAVYDYVRRAVDFRPDPPGLEILRGPDVLIEEFETFGRAEGDCDESAVLVASLLKALGQDAALILVTTAPTKPLHHVYAAAWVGERWFTVDPQEGIFGRAPNKIHRSTVTRV